METCSFFRAEERAIFFLVAKIQASPQVPGIGLLLYTNKNPQGQERSEIMRIKNKMKKLLAILLVAVMMFNVIPASAEVATPTDSAGEVMFEPEGSDGGDYKPQAGAAGVVYDVYDSEGEQIGEFVLSYDGRAYVDSEGEPVVYDNVNDIKGGRTEKMIKLAAGTYSLKQREKLYKSDVTVETGSKITRDKELIFFDVTSGKKTKARVMLSENNIDGIATPGDAARTDTTGRSTYVILGYTGTAALASDSYDITHEKDVRGDTGIICTLFKISESLTCGNTGYGFCMEEGKPAPSNYGVQSGSVVTVDKAEADIRRALYYSFVGPDPWSGWKDGGDPYNEYNIAGISATLDYYYYHNRTMSYIWKYAEFANEYIAWLEAQPYPLTSSESRYKIACNGNGMKNGSVLNTSYNIANKQQKSQTISVTPASKTGRISVSASKGVSIMISADGKIYKNAGSKTAFSGKRYMYFTANLAQADISKVNFSGATGYEAMMLDCGDSYQKVGFLGKGESQKLSLSVKWSKPRFRLKKVSVDGKALQGAEYLLYRSDGGKIINVVRFRTDKNGDGVVTAIKHAEAVGNIGDKVVALKAGIRYFIVETKAPHGYALNKGISGVTSAGDTYTYEARFGVSLDDGHVTSGGSFNCLDTGFIYKSTDNAIYGSLSMKKSAIAADGTSKPAENAVYTMYDSNKAAVAKFTSKKSGYGAVTAISSKYKTLKMLSSKGTVVKKNGVQLTGIPVGKYTIVETTAPEGCDLQPEKYAAVLTISDNGEKLVYYRAEKKTDGTVSWIKKTVTDTTDKNGVYGDSIGSICYDATDVVAGDPLKLVIRKVDAETGKLNTAGAASLANAVFKLEYYKGKTQAQATGLPDNTWYIKTLYEDGGYKAWFGDKYLIKNNKKYPSDQAPDISDGFFNLDPGTVRITEVTPSKGYLNITGDNAGYIRLSSGGKVTYIDDVPSTSVYLDGSGNTTYYNNVLDKNTIDIYEPVKRGDIEFSKKKINDDGSLSAMANVVFKITSKTTGEAHYVMTDADGHFSSAANKNSFNTNKNCEGYMETDTGYIQTDMDSSWGLWFTGDSDISCADIDLSKVSDDRGALPYDKYIIEEMRCDANKGYVLSDPQEVTVSENGVIEQVKDDFINVPYPSLTTLADHFVSSGDNVTLNDQVQFNWIEAGKDFTIKGIVKDKATGKPAVDGNGEYILATMTFKTDTVGAVNGYLPHFELNDPVKFTFNSIGMESTYVVCEYLYEGVDNDVLQVINDQVDITGVMTDDSGEPIAHADLKDESGAQTFSVPSIETDAFVDANGLQEIQATKHTKIGDKVVCHNLVPGLIYKLVSKAAFTKTGEGVVNGSEELVRNTEFMALKSEMSKTVYLPKFDATPYDGGTITVQQWLYLVTYDGDVLVAEHTDIDNERQQIRFVGIHTTAQDTVTGANFTSSIDEVKERTDYVTCTNLVVGKEYTLTTYLYEQWSKRKVKTSSGEYVTGTKTFIADKKNMVVPVTVRYNPVDCNLVGKVSVFYEYLTTLGKDVACHTDINDEGQSMKHPRVRTTLHESGSAIKEIKTSGIVKLTDTAKYINLKKGFEFTFIAKFINADTGNVINDGKDAVVENTFVAASDKGSVDMACSIDIQKSGLLKPDGTVSDVVCYEYVYYKGELLYAEEDITNRDQTISISPMSGKLTIHKRELQDKDKPVSGVTFMLFKKSETIIESVDVENFAGLNESQIKEIESWKNKTGDLYIGTYITDRDGDIVVTNLTPGDYYVVETKTLDTYILCTDRPEFVIDGTHDAEITVTNEAKVGYVTISGPESKPAQGGGGTPNTGDKAPVLWLILLLAFAISGIAAVIAAKRKKRSKSLIIIFIIGVGSISAMLADREPVIAAETTDGYVTETSTEVYYTDDENCYKFEFDNKKEDDKNTYTLDKVEYDKKKVNNTPIKIDGEVSKTESNVAENYKAPQSITQNGYTYILSQSSVTKDSKPVHVYSYKDTEYLAGEPVPDKTMQYIYVDENGGEHELVLPYSHTETLDTGYSDVITYNGVISGLNYQYIQIGDSLIASDGFTMSEDEMKSVLRENGYDVSELNNLTFSMSQDTYTDSKGNLCRNYTISAGRTGTKYRIYYADDVDDLDVTYKAVDVYVLSDADKDEIDKYNNETLVTATAYYKAAVKAAPIDEEKTMSPVKKAVLAGSIILGVLVLIALALYLVKGGRRDTDRKSKRDIKRDYKEL